MARSDVAGRRPTGQARRVAVAPHHPSAPHLEQRDLDLVHGRVDPDAHVLRHGAQQVNCVPAVATAPALRRSLALVARRRGTWPPPPPAPPRPADTAMGSPPTASSRPASIASACCRAGAPDSGGADSHRDSHPRRQEARSSRLTTGPLLWV